MINKKIMGLLLLFVVMLSVVPAALAETDSSGTEVDEDEDLISDEDVMRAKIRAINSDGARKAIPVAARVNSKVFDENGVAVIHQRAEAVKAEGFTKSRVIAHKIENYKAAQERLDALRERHEERRLQFTEEGKEVASLHKELQACREEGGEDCDEIFSKRNQAVKRQVLSAANYILSALDKLENRVEAASTLDEDEKATLLEEIEADRATIEAAVADLNEMIDEEADAEKIREAVKELKNALNTAHPNFRWTIAVLENAKMSGIINNFDATLEKIEARFDQAEKEGHDVSELRELFATFDAIVEDANENHQTAQDLYIKAFNDGDSKEVAEEGRELQKAARENLREAKKVLQQVFRELNQLLGEDLEETVEDAVEEE